MIFLISFIIVLVIAIFWVRGIDHMKENYPDYNGNDLFGEEDDEKDEKN